jgi:hypothetical protein
MQKLWGAQEPTCLTTHVACIITLHDAVAEAMGLFIDPDKLYVVETTTLNKWANKRGLQINSYEEWLINYQGEVYLHHWAFERSDRFNQDAVKSVFQKLQDPKLQKYESGILGGLELLLCVCGFKKAVIETAELHCTELVAMLLKEFKILVDIVSNNRIPPFEWWPEIIVKDKKRKGIIKRDSFVSLLEPVRVK